MSEFKTRDELRKIVIDSFAREEEVYAIYFFGREVDEKSDGYSDIDMVICSNDLAKTQAKYMEVFNGISPVIGSLLLDSAKNNLSQMVMLKNFSPYQKVDFSLTDCLATKVAAGFGPFMSVYDDGQASAQMQSKLVLINEHPVTHQLNDYLFSIPRFTKCLFRQDRDMYRRWEGIKNGALGLLYEKHFGWEKETSRNKLSAVEGSDLEAKLNTNERDLLNQILPPTGYVDVARSFAVSMQLVIDLCKRKAESFGVMVDHGFVQYIERFMNSEILRYAENKG